MGMFTRELKTLDDLFLHGLKDIYYAENKIVKTLPKLIEAASDAELKKGLKHHLMETEKQVERLDQVFEMLGEKPKGTRCPGIDGILTEGHQRRHHRIGASCRALRDHPLRNAHCLGRGAWQGRGHSTAGAQPQGREGGRQEVDHGGRNARKRGLDAQVAQQLQAPHGPRYDCSPESSEILR